MFVANVSRWHGIELLSVSLCADAQREQAFLRGIQFYDTMEGGTGYALEPGALGMDGEGRLFRKKRWDGFFIVLRYEVSAGCRPAFP